jgi:D-alanyl-D-alanine carboxypeptidase/D-alanyl-D-alanine-endopeptidase (penicillin-binding protein 4)
VRFVSVLLLVGLTFGGAGRGAPTKAQEIAIVPLAPSSIGILDPLATSSSIDSAILATLVSEKLADPRLGGGVTAYVIDANSQKVLLDINSDTQMIPASTLKIYTGIAAVNVLGAQTRFTTKVMREGNTLTLVGGGDPTVVSKTPNNWRGKPPGTQQPPSIEELAQATVAAIGPTTEMITVTFDDSLFTGPKAQESWPDLYLKTGEVAPAQGLTMDYGVTEASGVLPDPARATAQFYVDQLIARGVNANLADRAQASSAASELARIESATVIDIVERMITTSNNTLAEFLAHHLGGTQGDYSYAGGARVTAQALMSAGVDVTKLEIFDGSGLSRSNRTTAKDLVSALNYANTSDGLAWVALSGLPVAGISGTLVDRYDVAQPGRGTVRAKTGTLSKVISLSGTLVTATGDLLIFTFIANDLPNGTKQGEAALDDVVKVMVQCGCRVA